MLAQFCPGCTLRVVFLKAVIPLRVRPRRTRSTHLAGERQMACPRPYPNLCALCANLWIIHMPVIYYMARFQFR